MIIPELGSVGAFVETINNGLKQSGISPDELSMMDHICYRVETYLRYNEMIGRIGQKALLLDESEVSGRLIATFEFPEPLEVGGWRIPYFELPQPKDGSPYPEGLEHAEFVVIGGLDRFARNHSDLPFDGRGMSKLINPELGLKYAGMSVKFHEQQLGAVVRIEQRLASEAAEKAQEQESL
jgi:predicted metalloenzyme YecM